MYSPKHLARAAAIGAVLAVVACESNRDLLGPNPPSGGEIFRSYVAIGNSITAGFQSNGINDSTQRQSYALLLARSMGTRYAYPALAMPGCTAPIANTQTGALVGGAAAGACAARIPASVTEVLNNVAVPGARVADPTSPSTTSSNALTTFILGGKSQVQKALDANPTFVSVWIGNNDVLAAGLSGILVGGVVPGQNGITITQAQFQASYDALVAQLQAGAPEVKGVLIGVAQVANLPSFSVGGLIASSATIQAGLTAAAGKPVTVLPNCTGSTSLVNVPQLIAAIRAPTNPHPAVVSCVKDQPAAPVGDVFVLDAQEQASLTATVAGFNTYIQTKANAIGFAYWDPNPLFVTSRASGAIPPFPNLASATATFGTLISLDGVHPSAGGHQLIANGVIGAINGKYATTLPPQ